MQVDEADGLISVRGARNCCWHVIFQCIVGVSDRCYRSILFDTKPLSHLFCSICRTLALLMQVAEEDSSVSVERTEIVAFMVVRSASWDILMAAFGRFCTPDIAILA